LSLWQGKGDMISIQDLPAIAVIYLIIGVIILVASDPIAYRDFAARRFERDYGRTPPLGFVVVCFVVAIVLWPIVFVEFGRAMRGR
jgi:hypothetical protein